MNSRQIGLAIEKVVKAYLQRQGLKCLICNYRCRVGEIDLIMRESETIVFIEVRFRQNSAYGEGLETIGYYKRKKLIKTAQHYLQYHGLTDKLACRFDVVSVADDARTPNITWIKNAFGISS